MSEGDVLKQLPTGEIKTGHNLTPFGNLRLGAGFTSANKSQYLLLDRTASGSSVAASSHGEVYTYDTTGSEYGVMVAGTASVTPASAVRTKASIYGLITTGENTSGGNTSTGVGVQGIASTGNGSATAIGYGVNGAAVCAAGLVGQFAGISGQLNDASASAQSQVGTTTSRYAGLLTNLGTTKGAAFLYAVKSGTVPTNMSNGIVVDGASVDSNAFAVFSGGSTALWSVSGAGKQSMSTADVTIANLAAGATITTPAGRIIVTSTTVNAGAAGTIAVTATGLVTAASQVILTVQSHPGTVITNGSISVGLPAAPGSGTFTINVVNDGANNCAAQAGLTIGYMILN